MRSWFSSRLKHKKQKPHKEAPSLPTDQGEFDNHGTQPTTPAQGDQSVQKTVVSSPLAVSKDETHLPLPPLCPLENDSSSCGSTRGASKSLRKNTSGSQLTVSSSPDLRSSSSSLSAAYAPEVPYHSVFCCFQSSCLARPDNIALSGNRITQVIKTSETNSTQTALTVWTYHQLLEEVTSLSHVLSQEWVKLQADIGEIRIGLYLPRSVDTIIVMLACMRLGATVIPLDVHYPPGKTIQMIQAANLTCIFTMPPVQPVTYPSLPQLAVMAAAAAVDPTHDLLRSIHILDLVQLIGSCSPLVDNSSMFLPCSCHDTDGKISTAMFGIAYLLFTSGSTGRSKCVPMTHYQLAVHISSLAEALPILPEDVFAPMASFCFVAHTRLWVALSCSASLLVPNDIQRTSVIPFAALLNSFSAMYGSSVSILDTSPAFLRMLLHDWNEFLKYAGNAILKYLRRITLAGEIVTWRLMSEVYERVDQYKMLYPQTMPLTIINLYGATECASTICVYAVPRVETNQTAPSAFVPVGIPLPTTKIFLLDDAGAPLSAGALGSSVQGHVHVAGTRVETASGYENNTQATQAQFIRPYALSHQRLFKTGDMGRFTPSGDLELTGRSDNMVKIRGQRVELEELEATLCRNEHVRTAMVIAHRDDGNDEEATIVAYIVLSTAVMASLTSSIEESFPTQNTKSRESSHPHHLEIPHSRQNSSASSVFSIVDASSTLKYHSLLRTDVSKNHPVYYMPKHFVFVADVARNPNGKIDRQAGKRAAAVYLDKIKASQAHSKLLEENEMSPETQEMLSQLLHMLTEEERLLWSIWQKLFSLSSSAKQIEILQAVCSTKKGESDSINGAEDFDFFALGGDSLLANQLVSHVAQLMHKQFLIRSVFEYPCLIKMAEAIKDSAQLAENIAENYESSPSTKGTDESGREYRDYNMSIAQQSMWWINEISGKRLPAHHITHIYEVRSRQQSSESCINIRALEVSLSFLISRHDGLRTVFVVDSSGEPKQRVYLENTGSTTSLPGIKVDIQSVSSVEAMERVVDSVDHTPFNLSKWPLFRVSLVDVSQFKKACERGAAYYLSLTMHHLISDGWSTGLLLKELAIAYDHFSDLNSVRRHSFAGFSHPILSTKSTWQYTQFQHELENRLQHTEKNQLEYWINELNGASYLELPYDFVRPLQRSFRGDFLHLTLPSDISNALHTLSSSTRISLFNLMLASFHLLLSKYAKQTDIVTGTASGNRDSIQAQSVMGYCINMVACRSQVNSALSFVDFAKQVQAKTLNNLEHGSVPFQKVVDAINKSRSGGIKDDNSRNAIFDVIFLLQNQPIRKPYYSMTKDNSLSLHRRPFRAQHAQFDLAFLLEPMENELQLGINFNCDVFRIETVSRMVDNWISLLKGLITAPTSPMCDHDWISQNQRTQVVQSFNSKWRSIPLDYPIQHFFERQVLKTPDRLAVRTFEESWTYAEMEERTNRVAHAVIVAYQEHYKETLPTDVLIGLYVDRKAGCNMPAAVLGILKSGAAYVPLDPTYPSQRLGYMIHDAKCKVILTVSRMQSDLEALIQANNHPNNIASEFSGFIPDIPVLCIDELLARQPVDAYRTPPPQINGPHNLAYVIFTSGSTGKPKGVMINHISIVNLAHHMSPYMCSHHTKDGTVTHVSEPRCLQFSSISFDVAVFEWATTFSCGGCLCLVPSVDHLLGEALLHTIKRYDITTLLASASSVAAVPLDTVDGKPTVDLTRLSFMSAGSEALQESVLHRWMDACPQAFFNQYGPTEVTVTSHMCHYQPATINPYHNNKVIGGGISNMRSYVLDENMRPVPIGVIGELFIGGVGVARGYLNRPDLTKERFVPNLFLSEAAKQLTPNNCGIYPTTLESTRLYKTGDLVRWTLTGELEYHGRNDDQVKIRGFRIEIGEIEKRILQHEIVDGAVVVLRKEKQNGSKDLSSLLVCFFTTKEFVPENESARFTIELRNHVGSALPSYMVPSHFIRLESIPQTCTGKFDRNALTAMDIEPFLSKLVQNRVRKDDARRGKSKKSTSHLLITPPAPVLSLSEDDLINAVRFAWATALSLDVEDIEMTDHFFEIGGHSLLTVRVLQLLPISLKPHLSLADIFANPTMQAQVALLKSKISTANNTFRGDSLFDRTPTGYSSQLSNVDSALSLSKLATNTMLNEDIAIVGMAGRFPGGEDVHQFWMHLLKGDECIRSFNKDELLRAGIEPALLEDSNYVRALGLMGRHDSDVNETHARSIFGFDAQFFDYSAKDSEIIDPQQRQFLEVCAQALDDAGCVPGIYQTPDGEEPRSIGVYAGCGRNTYLADYLATSHDPSSSNQHWHSLSAGNDKDFLCSRVSFKLNLHGPSIVIQTACSSSLVAVHQAVQALQRGDCTMALAGGVSLGNLHPAGYLYQQDHILSPDGHCRTFDSEAQGTVRGQGLAVVALKPLHKAIADRDHIYAVLKASAINNDGSSKASYSAPNPEAQRRVIAQAFMLRPQIEPSSIGYVECHGTATKIGDVIELSALNSAYSVMHKSRQGSSSEMNPKSIPIGSVKSNIGHLDAAAGVAGLIKCALAVQRAIIPPSLHFHKMPSAVDMSNSPFYVTTGVARKFHPQETTGLRRAAVSSFGIGGTNAHVILEESPQQANATISTCQHVLCWSAKSLNSLRAASRALIQHMTALVEAVGKDEHVVLFGPNSASLAHIAYTLQMGRTHHNLRQFVVASSLVEAQAAIEKLQREEPSSLSVVNPANKTKSATYAAVCFLFAGQGSHFAGMGVRLYEQDNVFRTIADEVWSTAANIHMQQSHLVNHVTIPHIDVSVVESWNPTEQQLWLAPLGLFALEISVAYRLIHAGIKPDMVIGHSLGHFAASVIFGSLSLPEAALLIICRCALLHSVSLADNGLMLSVNATRALVEEMVSHVPDISIAAYNSPSSIVLAGPTMAVEQMIDLCQNRSVRCARLQTTHAFHSNVIEPILDQYRVMVTNLSQNRLPSVPLKSMRNSTLNQVRTAMADSVVGQLRATTNLEDNLDVDYWLAHTRSAVQFEHAAVAAINHFAGLTAKNSQVLAVELGPGKTCVTLLQQTKEAGESHLPPLFTTVQSICGYADIHKRKSYIPSYMGEDDFHLQNVLGTAFQLGHNINWLDVYEFTQRDTTLHKVSLPAYVFDHSVLYCPERALNGKRTRWLTKPASPTIQKLFVNTATLPSTEAPNSPEAPQNEELIRRTIRRAFADILGGKVEDRPDSANFFEEGGDSVSAVSLAATLNSQLNLSSTQMIRTSTLLLSASINELTNHVANTFSLVQARPVIPSITPGIDSCTLVYNSSFNSANDVTFAQTMPKPLSVETKRRSASASGMTALSRAVSMGAMMNEGASWPRSFGPLHVLQWGLFQPDNKRHEPQFLPLILIHAVGGDILQYRALQAHLHPAQPVFAFRAESLDGEKTAFNNIPALAAHYVSVLLHDQSPFLMWAKSICNKRLPNEELLTPPGLSPYSAYVDSATDSSDDATSNSLSIHTLKGQCSNYILPAALAGHSFGGLVAYEMAAQLRKSLTTSSIAARTQSLNSYEETLTVCIPPRGLNVSICKLILIDSPAPKCLPPRLDRAGVAKYISVALQTKLSPPSSISLSLPIETGNPAVIETWLAHQDAMHQYKVEESQQYVQNLDTLFLRPSSKNAASQEAGPSLNFHQAWLDVVETLTVSKVSGDHISMVRDLPHVDHTATKIKQFTLIQ